MASHNGPSCEYTNPCANNQCSNNATCLQLEEGNESYLCICPKGYSGWLCEKTPEQICSDKDPEVCPKLSSYCLVGTYKNYFVKDYCPKTCKNC